MSAHLLFAAFDNIPSATDVNAFAKMTEGTPLGTLLSHLHELNVHFRGVEEHI